MKYLRQLAVPVIFLLMSIIALLSATPTAQDNIPTRDSGVFLYMGHALLDGEIPYRDVWDHKPPVVFFLNMLGLALLPDSFWGVWLLQVLLLTAALCFGYYGLRRLFPAWLVLFGLSVMVCQIPFVLQDGNYTEFYVTFFQFGAIFLLTNTRWRYRYFGIGVSGGLTFMLRQNMIGLWLVLGLLLLWQLIQTKNWRTVFSIGLQLACGMVIPIVAICLWFAWHNALDDMWQAAFVYNFAYVDLGGTTENQLQSLWVGLGRGLYFLLPLLWLMTLIGMWQPANRSQINFLVIILLPLELYLATISGHDYGHYYMLWLVVFALALITGFYPLTKTQKVRNWFRFRVFKRGRYTIAHYLGAIVGAAIVAWLGLFIVTFGILSTNAPNRSLNLRYQAAKMFLDRDAQANDTLLVWGAEAYFHIVSGLQPVSRYVYQYPLTRRGYTNADIINEFFADLEAAPPTYIIDTHNPDVPPIATERLAAWYAHTAATVQVLNELEAVITWINSHYEALNCSDNGDTQVEWCIYKLKPMFAL